MANYALRQKLDLLLVVKDVNGNPWVNTFKKQTLKLLKRKNDGPERWLEDCYCRRAKQVAVGVAR